MTGAALSACAGWLARLQLEGLLILGLCFALDRGARRRSAAARRGIWALGVATLLLLPLPRLLLPTSTPALPQLASALALALWLAGAALLLRRLARGVARARRYVQNASPMPEGAWTATLASLLRPGAPVAVALRVTDELDGPAAIGALRPVILVPRALLGASPERRRSMLAHELAHVARADGLVLLAGAQVRALFWITPMSWWALSRLRAVAEDAADDAVLGAGVRSSSYAALLVELARARLERAGRSGAGGLRHRVRAILDPARRRGEIEMSRESRWSVPRLASAAALLACSLTACEARSEDAGPADVDARAARELDAPTPDAARPRPVARRPGSSPATTR